MTAVQKLEQLRAHDPGVAIVVSRQPDPSFVWDGDGPDPVEDGFSAYDVTVQAIRVLDGRRIIGEAHLGGSYYRLGEPTGEINGYLPQMIDEAVHELGHAMLSYQSKPLTLEELG
jgi:hypothetical protein